MKPIFITGTDTGVGKTVFTAHLLHYLRSNGHNALALKPFCSGGREDARLLQSLQTGLTLDEINPFHYRKALAPGLAAPKDRKKVTLKSVVDQIFLQKNRCETLLVEGAGGLMVPLGKGFLVADLIVKLEAAVVVVARNKLGAINHILLTVNALRSLKIKVIGVVVMETARPDGAAASNLPALKRLLRDTPIFSLPFLGEEASQTGGIKKSAKKIQKTLARFHGAANLSAF